MLIDNRSGQGTQAQVINQNYDVQKGQQAYANEQLKQNEIQKYIDTKLSEGYTRDGNELKKTVGNTTTIITVDSNGNVNIIEKNITPATTVTTGTSTYNQLYNDYTQLDRQITRAERKGIKLSQDVYNQRDRLYTQMRNLQNTGTAFYTTETPSTETVTKTETVTIFKPSTAELGEGGYTKIVRDDKGLITGYVDVAGKPAIKSEGGVIVQGNTNTPFYAPKQSNISETSTAFSTKITLPTNNIKNSDSVLNARTGADYRKFDTELYLQNQAYIKPSLQAGATLLVYSAGKGTISALKDIYTAGGTAIDTLDVVGGKTTTQGVIDLINPTPMLNKVTDTTSSIFGAVGNPNILTVSKAVEETAYTYTVIEGAPRVIGLTSEFVKPVTTANKFISSEVKASAYPISTTSERAQIFVKDTKIGASSYSNDYTPIRQLTVDVSEFNKRQKYFSNPSVDAPKEVQLNLAGTETPATNTVKGTLPLETKPVAPFESNTLTIEQIGKKPLIDATSTAQSKVVDRPVQKGFNADTITGAPIVDTINPERSTIVSDKTIQTDFNTFTFEKRLTTEQMKQKLMDEGKLLSVDTVDKFSNDKVMGKIYYNNKGSDILIRKDLNPKDFADTLKHEVKHAQDVAEFGTTQEPSTYAFEGNQEGFLVFDKVIKDTAPKQKNIPSTTSNTPPISNERVNNFNDKIGTVQVKTENPTTILISDRTNLVSKSELKVSNDYEYNPVTQEYTKRYTPTDNTVLTSTETGKSSTLPVKFTIVQQKPSTNVTEQPLNMQANRKEIKVNTNIVNAQIPVLETRTTQEPALKINTEVVQLQQQRLGQESIQKTETQQQRKFTLNTVQRTASEPISTYTINTNFNTTRTPPPPVKPEPTGTKRKQLFSAVVKTRGQFKTVGSYASMSEAFNRGKQYVQNTASATFKVVSGGQTVKPQGFLPRGFTASKSVSGAVVQQRGFRIQSQGEKIEISSRGRATKNIRRGLFQ